MESESSLAGAEDGEGRGVSAAANSWAREALGEGPGGGSGDWDTLRGFGPGFLRAETQQHTLLLTLASTLRTTCLPEL